MLQDSSVSANPEPRKTSEATAAAATSSASASAEDKTDGVGADRLLPKRKRKKAVTIRTARVAEY